MSEPNLLRFVASAAAPMGRGNLLERLGATMPEPGPAPVEARNATPLRPQGVGEIGRSYLAQMAGLAPSGVAANTVMGFAASPAAIRAFHGSPHRFDRFDMSRIGTGEGAQAYGHGLYFAGNEDVARTYRDALSSPTVRVNGRSILGELNRATDPDAALALEVAHRNGTVFGTTQRLADLGKSDPAFRRASEWWAQNQGRFSQGSEGSMYEVNLRTDPSRLLDWDAPLSAQPQAVREGVRQSPLNAALEARGYQGGIDGMGPNRSVGSFYDQAALAAAPGGRMDYGAASAALRAAGIDGIQYLDGGSRAAGQGTRNYVMFDDSLIDIVRRYGLLGLIGGGAAAGGAEAAAP